MKQMLSEAIEGRLDEIKKLEELQRLYQGWCARKDEQNST